MQQFFTVRTPAADVEAFNRALRRSPAWQDWIRSRGMQPDGTVWLSDRDREALRADLEGHGAWFGKEMGVGRGGVVRQDEGVAKYVNAARWPQPPDRSALHAAIAALAGLPASWAEPTAHLVGDQYRRQARQFSSRA